MTDSHALSQVNHKLTEADLDAFVEECLMNYAEAETSGEWHQCHHPKPANMGGTTTVPLLVSDHAKHGVIQSEVYGHPCIWGWERNHLEGKWLELFDKWWSIHQTNAACKGGGSKLAAEKGAEVLKAMTFEERSARSKVVGKLSTPARLKQRKAASDAGRAVANSRKWRCLSTGKVTTAGALTNYQRSRGIDTSLRERVESVHDEPI